MNISTCRACAVRPCTHDWESHARHLAANETKALFHDKWLDAEAAITRVRALCDTQDFCWDGTECRHDPEDCYRADLLRALDGGTE